MYKLFIILSTIVLLSCKTTTYYIVRHAEKEAATTMTTDVPLSSAGKQRSEALKDQLESKHITAIYSTNYVRTKSTAQPLADVIHVPIQTYNPQDTSFVTRLMSMNGNILIVGHSNTVDDIVNKLTGKTEIPGDLPDSEYGDLFIVKKKGSHYSFEKGHFGPF